MDFLAKTTTTSAKQPDWVFLGFLIVGIIVAIIAIFWIKRILNQRKNYQKGFEAFGNQKYKYNLWNLIMAIFICFTGIIGALISDRKSVV